MKLGILTFHDGINFGAFAQVYSLQECLKELGHDVAVLNYKSRGHWIREYMAFLRTKQPRLFINNLRKIWKFRKVQAAFLNRSRFSFSLQRLKHLALDAVIVGADEVWNFETRLIGFDPTFFVPQLANTPYIAYAPSFGSVGPSTRVPSELVDGLRQFNRISVRDNNSKDLIAKNLDLDVPVTLDPTFLFPTEKNAVKPNRSGYWLYYGTEINAEYQQAILKLAHQHGKALVAIGYIANWADENPVDIDPFEWMGWIASADFVITTMFHGTIYSILQKVQFATLITEYRKNKLTPMMENLSLTSRRVEMDSSFADALELCHSESVDYDLVGRLIDEHRKASHEFLQSALSEVGDS